MGVSCVDDILLRNLGEAGLTSAEFRWREGIYIFAEFRWGICVDDILLRNVGGDGRR